MKKFEVIKTSARIGPGRRLRLLGKPEDAKRLHDLQCSTGNATDLGGKHFDLEVQKTVILTAGERFQFIDKEEVPRYIDVQCKELPSRTALPKRAVVEDDGPSEKDEQSEPPQDDDPVDGGDDPQKGADPEPDPEPAEGDDPVEGDDPIESDDPADGEQ